MTSPTVDNTQPAAENPIRYFSVEYLGEQTSDNSCSRRDLGFTGCLRGKWYAVYGDTLWCAPGIRVAEQSPPGFHGMVRNALSELTDDPLVVHDLHLNEDQPIPHQKQLVPFNEDWGETNTFGFGGTSIVETDPATGTGALYYLVVCLHVHLWLCDSADSIQNAAEWYKGAGVAKIELIDGVPTVTKRYGEQGWWWNGDTTPKYGDVAAYRDVNSEWIYILGNPPNYIKDFPMNWYIYQARVRASDAFDLDKYEYWWGRQQGWRRDVLTRFDCESAVLWGAGQGQIVYNEHFQAYIYVHMSEYPSLAVYQNANESTDGPSLALRFAPLPEGPWSVDKELYKAEPIDGGFVYAGIAYPHLDPSGRTLTVGWTNNNHIQILKITFV